MPTSHELQREIVTTESDPLSLIVQEKYSKEKPKRLWRIEVQQNRRNDAFDYNLQDENLEDADTAEFSVFDEPGHHKRPRRYSEHTDSQVGMGIAASKLKSDPIADGVQRRATATRFVEQVDLKGNCIRIFKSASAAARFILILPNR